MLHFSKWQIGLVIAMACLTIFFCLPNALPPAVYQKGPSWWRPMQLGLDLRGGSSLLLEVDTSAVLKGQFIDLEETIGRGLRDVKIRPRSVRIADNAVTVTLNDAAEQSAARSEIGKITSGMVIETQGEDRIRVTIPQKLQTDRQIAAVQQSVEIVRRRIDEYGTSEASVQPQGTERILVELPGVGDPERIIKLIGKTAKLDFHLLEPNATSTDPHDLPPGTVLLPGDKDDTHNYVVRRRIEVSGERLIDAQPSFKDGRPIVNFTFDTAGGRRFAQVTGDNIGNRLAIVLDDKIISAPTINGQIGARGLIEGGFTVEGAKDLAVLLRAGALPAPLTPIEQRTVGPGLGQDSIRDGVSAAVLGGALVIVFMILAYHTFGLFAVVGQIFHMGTLFALLSVLGGALTLPGIAGAILSLGMAVDANVLIYERMREELESGKSLLNSITSGFSHAYATIIDSNVTNLLASGLLFMLGAGPVKGFAVTLTIGILTSIFSAVMVTRLQVWAWYRTGKRKELPI